MEETRFYGDDNVAVKWIQQEQYMPIVSQLVHEAIGKYNYAACILNVETGISSKLAAQFPLRYDFNGIYEAYELMAAYFRFKEYPHGPLFQDDVDKKDCINKWPQWASEEINSLLESPEFTRAIVLAVAEKDNEVGRQNEQALIQYLIHRYDEMIRATKPQ